MKITQASVKNLDQLISLFDGYRVFYGQESDLEADKDFLYARFQNKENIVFLAQMDNVPVDFTQLYKTFSSVSLKPFYILNDLFVVPEFRKKGIGKALLDCAKLHCKNLNYKGLALETARDNSAQKLY